MPFKVHVNIDVVEATRPPVRWKDRWPSHHATKACGECNIVEIFVAAACSHEIRVRLHICELVSWLFTCIPNVWESIGCHSCEVMQSCTREWFKC